MSRAVASRSKASCLGLALRNARWFESSWEKKFSHEISASVWDRCPPSIVMHLGSYDRHFPEHQMSADDTMLANTYCMPDNERKLQANNKLRARNITTLNLFTRYDEAILLTRYGTDVGNDTGDVRRIRTNVQECPIFVVRNDDGDNNNAAAGDDDYDKLFPLSINSYSLSSVHESSSPTINQPSTPPTINHLSTSPTINHPSSSPYTTIPRRLHNPPAVVIFTTHQPSSFPQNINRGRPRKPPTVVLTNHQQSSPQS
ncbi:hypothetical protein ANN_26190 [Periplaneta americana]|uniref:Uncharacterized protein n=1 Tax=Periplaneta americana TaxID=6978 RepID=A0ABQ8S5L2_PERAM|nr:hypothetical protein ANN_26190 [Periplaneta americana]